MYIIYNIKRKLILAHTNNLYNLFDERKKSATSLKKEYVCNFNQEG